MCSSTTLVTHYFVALSLRGALPGKGAEAISKTGLPRLRLAMTQEKKENPPSLKGGSRSIRTGLGLGYSPRPEDEYDQGNYQYRTDDDYRQEITRGY